MLVTIYNIPIKCDMGFIINFSKKSHKIHFLFLCNSIAIFKYMESFYILKISQFTYYIDKAFIR